MKILLYNIILNKTSIYRIYIKNKPLVLYILLYTLNKKFN